MYTLEKKELEIMELFWHEDRALTHADIRELLTDHISRNTVYQHLNNLLDKGALQTGPSVRRGRTYGRSFVATISRAEYFAMQVADVVDADDTTLYTVFSYFLGSKNITNDTLDKLEKRIQQKRRDLNP